MSRPADSGYRETMNTASPRDLGHGGGLDLDRNRTVDDRRPTGVMIVPALSAGSRSLALCSLVVAAGFSFLITGCKTAEIVRLTVSSPNDPVLREGNTVNFASDIRLNGVSLQSSNLTLTRLRPAGAEVVRPLTAGAVTGDTTRYAATVLPSDSEIAFQSGNRWKATVTVGYPYVDSTEYKRLSQEFEIFEPVNTMSFVGGSPLEGWTMLRYHKFTPPYGQETSFTSQPQLQAYPADNFPQPREGDNAIGFPITLSPTSNWSTGTDHWSAIFVSPRVNAWTSFQVKVKNEGTGLHLLSYVDVVTDPGTGAFRSVPLHVSTDGVHWYSTIETELLSATEAEPWHTYYFSTVGTELAAGSIRTIHLEVFGGKDGLSALQNKRVLIDQVIGQ